MRISDWSSYVCSSDLPVGDFLGGALFGGGTDMAKGGDFRVASGPGKLGHKRVGVQLLGGHGRGDFRTRQKSLTIEWRDKRAALHQRARPIQPHGIQSLEYMAVLNMRRGADMFIC